MRQTLATALPDAEPQFDERLYLASAETIIETVIAHAGDADTVLSVGHNPGLQELLYELVSPANENALFEEAAVKLPTAAFCVFECDIDDWSELAPDCAKLVHFARPRDLDPELGPQH